MEYITHYEEQTKSVGRQLATMVSGSAIITLSGDLGAGKTTFTKGFSEGLGVKKTVTSPTFSLMNVYPVQDHQEIEQFVHIDTYRLENEEELRAIGVEEYLGDAKTIVMIEWPEKVAVMLKKYKNVIEVKIGSVEKDDQRIIEVVGIE